MRCLAFSTYTTLHHYKSDLAHISDFDSLVIGISKSERWAKIIKKWMTSSICTKFAHFWVVLVRKWMVQKFLISYRFDFLDGFFFRDFLMIPYELFHSFCSELNGQKWICIVTTVWMNEMPRFFIIRKYDWSVSRIRHSFKFVQNRSKIF